jgi:hypothetical protein
VAAALRAADPVGAVAAERETNWRSGYPGHLRRLVEAGLPSRAAALAIAAGGLHAVHDRFRFRGPDGEEIALQAATVEDGPAAATVTVVGQGQPETAFSLPIGGERLSGTELGAQLDAWTRAGVLEPSAADLVRAVVAHPEWLRLDGRTVVVLGAGAEMGPLPSRLRWGARVAAVGLPRAEVWSRVMQVARRGAGTLLAPAADTDEAVPGLDLLTEIAAATSWVGGIDGPLVLGNYVYADGVRNLRLAAAVDALTVQLQVTRPQTAFAFLATPTDVFAVPGEVVQYALGA